jgi:hypothetical protein
VGRVLVGDLRVVHTLRSVRSHIKTVVRQSICRVNIVRTHSLSEPRPI